MMQKESSLWSAAVLGSSSAGTLGGGTNTNSRGGSTSAPITSSVTTTTPVTGSAVTNNGNYAFLSTTANTASSSLLVQSGAGGMNGIGGSTAGLMPAMVSHERSQELCKYFLNGGCLRGAQCQYLHELPDERHLDVNGYGYILNPNVHNAQKTLPLAMNSSSTGAVQGNGGAITNSSPPMLGLNVGNGRQFHGAKSKTQSSFMVGMPTQLSFQMSATSVKAPPPRYRPPEPFLEYNLPPTLALPFNTPSKEVALQLTRTILQS